jgi:hypothetical protein
LQVAQLSVNLEKPGARFEKMNSKFSNKWTLFSISESKFDLAQSVQFSSDLHSQRKGAGATKSCNSFLNCADKTFIYIKL